MPSVSKAQQKAMAIAEHSIAKFTGSTQIYADAALTAPGTVTVYYAAYLDLQGASTTLDWTVNLSGDGLLTASSSKNRTPMDRSYAPGCGPWECPPGCRLTEPGPMPLPARAS